MKLWTPSSARVNKAQSTEFTKIINHKYNENITNFHELYDWSVINDLSFWSECWDFTQIIGEKGDKIISEGNQFYEKRFFPNGSLNFAENLLKRRDDKIAIVFWGEDKVKTSITFNELYEQVAKFRQFLIAQGVGENDRVAAVLPNISETIIAMLATTSLGAVWSSSSPDFGVQGILDRFGQIEPTVLLITNGYYYNGKKIDCREKFVEVIEKLPTVNKAVLVEYVELEKNTDIDTNLNSCITFQSVLLNYPAAEIEFTKYPFNHPLYIMFSSGTTGVPKCIVHCAGGVLLQQAKEMRLHADVKLDDSLFYFTTCGWMMWNWLVSGLSVGAKLCLYDGSPFVKRGVILFDYIDAENITHFGTSAKYIDALGKHKIHPAKTHNLSSLQTILSTGSPLSGQSFDYVYEKIKSDICLSSISGGTDIVSCFVLGSPALPVYRGEVQTRGLGLAVNALDDNQRPIIGEKGELVCQKPFPCMPLGFWNDKGNKKYHNAYFEQYEGIWCHGDYVEITENNGMVFHGRSDSVLNPGGVRIGTAEIYRQVEKIDEVFDSVVIGQNYKDDVRVVLFVQLREGLEIDDDLKIKIRKMIKENTTPRHVPGKIVQVSDIPKTKSGKIVEIAVRDTVHGDKVKNKEALANPESLALFANIEVLM